MLMLQKSPLEDTPFVMTLVSTTFAGWFGPTSITDLAQMFAILPRCSESTLPLLLAVSIETPRTSAIKNNQNMSSSKVSPSIVSEKYPAKPGKSWEDSPWSDSVWNPVQLLDKGDHPSQIGSWEMVSASSTTSRRFQGGCRLSQFRLR